MEPDVDVLAQPPSGRRRRRYLLVLWPVLVVAVVWVFLQFQTERNIRISDGRARETVLQQIRSDGMMFRTFVERRFGRKFCAGDSIGGVNYAVSRMMGGQPNESILIDMEVEDPSLRCEETVATIAAIKVGRAYRDHHDFARAIPAEKWMDSAAQPEWLPEFRRGDAP